MKSEYLVAKSIDDAIAMACDAVGISTPSRWAPGRWVRCDVLDAGRSGRGDGAVMVAPDLGAATAYNWHTSHHQFVIVGDLDRRPDPATRRAWAEAAAAARREAEAEAERRHQRAAQTAASVWAAARDDAAIHPYVMSKSLSEHVKGVRTISLDDFIGIAGYRPQAGGDPLAGPLLVAPVIAADGSVRTLELIAPDGRKAALAGGKRRCHFWAPDEAWRTAETVVIAEGVATALSALAALDGMDAAVIAALSAGNLEAAGKAVVEARGDRRPRIVIAADLDGEGAPCAPARAAAGALGAALAAPPPPEGRDPRGWDLDDLRRTCGTAAVRQAIEAALATTGAAAATTGAAATPRARFELIDGDRDRDPGVYHISIEARGDGVREVAKWICSPVRVVAVTHDARDGSYGRLIEVLTPSGRWHRWAMPAEVLAGSGEELRRELLAMGARLATGPRERSMLFEYLQTVPDRTILCTTRAGWCHTPDGDAYVLPNGITISAHGDDEKIIYQGPTAVDGYTTSGTLAGWQREVAAMAVGNPIIMLAISAALAGPILEPCGLYGGGIHIVGDSSCGKTTALHAALSVWGGPELMRSWRATANGLEAIASSHSDGILALDELSEADPKEVGAIVYALVNGVGKARASRSGAARPVSRWRVMVMSSGEVTIETAMAEGGIRAKAGHSVRIVSIPATRRYGVFDMLHAYTSGKDLADALRAAAARHHGHAWVPMVQAVMRIGYDGLRDLYAKIIKSASFAAAGGGQDGRVAGLLAAVALAGEVATDAGIVPWPSGAATAAAAQALATWRAMRDAPSGENAEKIKWINMLMDFIDAHGDARFSDAADPGAPPVRGARAGWWVWHQPPGGERRRRWLLTPAAMREALGGLQGQDLTRALQALRDAGVLQGSGTTAQARRVAGEVRRVYEIDINIEPVSAHGRAFADAVG